MKQIKTFLTVTLFLTAFLAHAQIKVHNDNQISIGSLTKQYGIQYYPEGFTLFERNTNPDYSWITITQTTNIRSKCWVVRNPNYEVINPFYVSGGGIVYRVGEYDLADSRYQNEIGDIENPSDIVNGLSAFYYSFSNEIEAGNNRDLKRRVGFSAQDIEKVLPEAVESDENGVLYLDYEAITAVLVEALKEQQREIDKQQANIEKLYNLLNKYMDKNVEGLYDNIQENNVEMTNKLFQNHPNPFGDVTIIDYFLVDVINHAEIMIFNMMGETMKVYSVEGHGKGCIKINSGELNNGLYYYGLIVDNVVVDTKKMIISK